MGKENSSNNPLKNRFLTGLWIGALIALSMIFVKLFAVNNKTYMVIILGILYPVPAMLFSYAILDLLKRIFRKAERVKLNLPFMTITTLFLILLFVHYYFIGRVN